MKKLFLFVSFISLFLSSYAQNPLFEWVKTIGGTNLDVSYQLAIDYSGNIYVTGRFQGTADFDPGTANYSLSSNGNSDIYILKLDSTGNFVWAKALGGSSYDSGYSINIDATGNPYITGAFQNNVDFDPGPATNTLTAIGLEDMFVLKLDAAGNFMWVKSMGGPSATIRGVDIKLEKTGNIYIGGIFAKTIDFDPGIATYTINAGSNDNVFISKLDAAGNFMWAKSMGGAGNDALSAIALDSLNNIYSTGKYYLTADFDPGASTYTLVSSGNSDIFVSKLDASGNFVWAKSMGGTNIDYGYSIAIDNFNNVYSTGIFQSTADFNPGAATYSIASAGGYDMYVSKLDVSGNFIWTKSVGGPNDDHALSIALDTVGSAYITGFYSGACDFDPGASTYTIGSVSASSDAHIFKLDVSGNFAWAKNIGGTQSKNGNFILLDRDENVFTLGDFQGTADFDPEATTYTITSTGITDSYIHKMSQCHSISANITSQNVNCDGMSDGSATIHAIGGTPLTYSWSNGNTNPVAINLTAGTYSCIVTNTCGNFITRTITVTQPAPVSLTISSTPSNSTICNGQSVTLNASGALSYTWTNGVSDGVSFTPTVSNSYTVIGTDLNNCTDTAFIDITVLYPTTFSQTVNLCAGQLLTVGTTTYNTSGTYTTNLIASNGCDSIVSTDLSIEPVIDISTSQNGITITANATGVSYQWINCSDSSQIPGENNQSFTPAVNGTYAVLITSGNCQDTSACTNITTVNIKENNDKQPIVIYPNPTKGVFTIQVNSLSQILVVDALSQVMINEYKDKGLYSFDLTKMDNGIYFIKIICNTKQEVVKLIKQ